MARSRVRAVPWDGTAAVVLAIAALLPQLAGSGLHLSELPVRQPDALSVALTLGQCLPLAVRRRWPAACLAIVAVCFAVDQALGYPASLAGIGLLVALYSAGAHAARSRRALAAVATAAYVALAISLSLLRSPERPLDYVTFYVLLLACWGAGAWIRARQRGEAERRRKSAEQAIAEERAYIARELHDVVTHHVTAMVVQADAAKYLIPGAPDRAADSVAAIGGTGRRALAELRELLGVLDAPGRVRTADPAGAANTGQATSTGQAAGRTPALGTFGDLVTQARRAGQPVELFEEGPRAPAAASVELAAYRVAQEALTNAVKHAPGRQTTVRVRYGEELDITVTTDGPVIAAGGFTPGRGLTGLRERVTMCGGELTAQGRPEGGFRVRARMPARPAP